MERKIKKILTGFNTQDGAGVKLTRVFSNQDAYDLDPFLLLDFFNTDNPEDYIKGFPWHPHRGIETVTYFIKGLVEHQDSLGNKGKIGDGDCQWMTAGSGIIHQEMPQEQPVALGVQLWINLPKKDKMMDPAYRDIASEDIIEIEDENIRVRIISGEYKGKKGTIEGNEKISPNMLDIRIKNGESLRYETKEDHSVIVFIFDGEGEFQGEILGQGNGILYDKGNNILLKAVGERDLRVLVLTGKPLEEPIAWGGPIVMNTREELNEAFREIDEGTFIKTESKFIY